MRKGIYCKKVISAMLLCGLCLGDLGSQAFVSAQEVSAQELLPQEVSTIEVKNVLEILEDTETIESIESTEMTESTEETVKPEEIINEPEQKQELEIQFQKYNYKTKKFTISWELIPKESTLSEEQKNLLVYRVSVYRNNAWKMVVETSDLTTTIEIPNYGKKYLYKVEAYLNTDTLMGEMVEENALSYVGESSEMSVCFPKEMSKIITTATSSKKVKLSWESVKGATEYIVYQKVKNGEYVDVKTTSKKSAKLDVVKNETYTYRVVPVYQNEDLKIIAKGKSISFDNGEFVSIDHQKYTYKEMESDIKSLSQKYGEYVTYESIGKSEQGREIYDVILGNKNAKNCVLVVSTLHAREYVATIALMKQLEYYLQNYNRKVEGVVPAEVFEKCCVHYIMMANPDGVTISQRRDKRRKTNANNVNLNCNFPYKLSKLVAGSQKETQAIMAITNKLNKEKKLYEVNYHAMGEIIFGDYKGKSKTLKKKITDMYQIARETTGYRDAGGYGSGGLSRGCYREYLIYVVKVPSITIEVGDVWCPVPQCRYSSVVKKNRFVILREANYANSLSK